MVCLGAKAPLGIDGSGLRLVLPDGNTAMSERLRAPMRASGGPALRRHASQDALLLDPPHPSPRPSDRRPHGRLPLIRHRTSVGEHLGDPSLLGYRRPPAPGSM